MYFAQSVRALLCTVLQYCIVDCNPGQARSALSFIFASHNVHSAAQYCIALSVICAKQGVHSTVTCFTTLRFLAPLLPGFKSAKVHIFDSFRSHFPKLSTSEMVIVAQPSVVNRSCITRLFHFNSITQYKACANKTRLTKGSCQKKMDILRSG